MLLYRLPDIAQQSRRGVPVRLGQRLQPGRLMGIRAQLSWA